MLLVFTACNNEEYVPPTFPENVVPTVVIEGADDTSTGVFAAIDAVSQTFNVAVNTAKSLFPDVTVADVSVEISDDTNFTFGYTAGESTFTVIPKSINSTSSSYTASVTASIEDIYGGNTYTIEVEQEPADIPHFVTQPSDVAFAQNFALGDTVVSAFVIDPAGNDSIDKDNLSVTESEYCTATFTDRGNDNYAVTFEATMYAVNQISLSSSDIVIECEISLTYYGLVERSDTFTVTLTK